MAVLFPTQLTDATRLDQLASPDTKSYIAMPVVKGIDVNTVSSYVARADDVLGQLNPNLALPPEEVKASYDVMLDSFIAQMGGGMDAAQVSSLRSNLQTWLTPENARRIVTDAQQARDTLHAVIRQHVNPDIVDLDSSDKSNTDLNQGNMLVSLSTVDGKNFAPSFTFVDVVS